MKNILQYIVSVSIALTVSVMLTILLFISPGFIDEIDMRLSDFRFRYRGVQQPNPNVVILAIDEKSINTLGRWVWSREKIKTIVDQLRQYEPSVVAFDIVFSESENEEIDTALGKSIDDNGNVVLGYFFREDGTELINSKELDIHRDSRIKLIKYGPGADNSFLKSFNSVELNIENIARGAKGFGFFNIFPENDGIYRKSQLLLKYAGDVFPSLHLEGVRLFLRSNILLSIKHFGVESLLLNRNMIPVDEHGSFLLDYYGASGTFPTYSIADVFDGTLDKDILRDKLVFIGATEIGIADIRATPFDPTSPGVEIQATAAANMLDGRFLVKNSFTEFINIVLIFSFTLVFALLLAGVKRTVTGLILLLAFITIHVVTNYLFFSRYSYLLSTVYPALSLSLTYVLYEGYRNVVVEKRSRFLKRAFSSYVSPDLVSQIMEDPDSLKLGGQKKTVTILFSDIRGFTSMSESTSPEDLVALLNEYLNPMTDIVMSELGTLDKYIGDAVMAIFGAPLDLPDHADRCCRSAIKMMNRVDQINNNWTGRGLPPINIGIGINTGEAIVGNMGANIRFDYTAIGDNVNLASRLEGLNKYYGTEIIISESTKDGIPEDNYLIRELDVVRVKGKSRPISIFEIIPDRGNKEDIKKSLEIFTDALGEYRGRNFGKAEQQFKQVLEYKPDDPVALLYIQRCHEYMKNPPPGNWDFVYTAESK